MLIESTVATNWLKNLTPTEIGQCRNYLAFYDRNATLSDLHIFLQNNMYCGGQEAFNPEITTDSFTAILWTEEGEKHNGGFQFLVTCKEEDEDKGDFDLYSN